MITSPVQAGNSHKTAHRSLGRATVFLYHLRDNRKALGILFCSANFVKAAPYNQISVLSTHRYTAPHVSKDGHGDSLWHLEQSPNVEQSRGVSGKSEDRSYRPNQRCGNDIRPIDRDSSGVSFVNIYIRGIS
jgi:hypothetical protein